VLDNNSYNFGVSGSVLSDFMNSVDTSNLVNGRLVYCITSESNLVISPENYLNIGYLAVVNCTNVTVQGLTLTNEGQGILLAFTNDSKIANNNATNNEDGICLEDSSNNTVSGNNVTANNVTGICLYSSSNNTIYHNNFIGNAKQVSSDGSPNTWDDGYPSGGNHWSDYTGVDQKSGPYQNLTGSDGIGDTPYTINSKSTDNYPLMKPYVFGDLNHDGKVDIKDIHIVASAFGSSPGESNWNPIADVNQDGKVDIRDVALVAKEYGEQS
jgi:parallel beta-helix repeat protein